jgi:four helix bundle protein
MSNFKDLEVASAARLLARRIYRVTDEFPAQERYGITAQLRRAAVSIGANIAEGCGRKSTRELIRFADIASGSAHEVEFLLMLSQDLGLLHDKDWSDLQRKTIQIQRMLAGLKRALRNSTFATASST